MNQNFKISIPAKNIAQQFYELKQIGLDLIATCLNNETQTTNFSSILLYLETIKYENELQKSKLEELKQFLTNAEVSKTNSELQAEIIIQARYFYKERMEQQDMKQSSDIPMQKASSTEDDKMPPLVLVKSEKEEKKLLSDQAWVHTHETEKRKSNILMQDEAPPAKLSRITVEGKSIPTKNEAPRHASLFWPASHSSAITLASFSDKVDIQRIKNAMSELIRSYDQIHYLCDSAGNRLVDQNLLPILKYPRSYIGGRYQELMTVKGAFTIYPGYQLPLDPSISKTKIYISEGPETQSLADFFIEYGKLSKKAKQPAVIVAIGPTSEYGHEKWKNYLEFEQPISLEQWLQETTGNNVIIPDGIHFKCYKLDPLNTLPVIESIGERDGTTDEEQEILSQPIYVLHIWDWPDNRQGYAFNSAQLQLWRYLFSHLHNVLYHCSAGLMRSPAMATAHKAFLEKSLVNTNDWLPPILAIYDQLQKSKPGAGGLSGEQLIIQAAFVATGAQAANDFTLRPKPQPNS